MGTYIARYWVTWVHNMDLLQANSLFCQLNPYSLQMQRTLQNNRLHFDHNMQILAKCTFSCKFPSEASKDNIQFSRSIRILRSDLDWTKRKESVHSTAINWSLHLLEKKWTWTWAHNHLILTTLSCNQLRNTLLWSYHILTQHAESRLESGV